MRPYEDYSRQMVGLRCTATGEVWQIDVVSMNDSLRADPDVAALMADRDGREALARAVSKGFRGPWIPPRWTGAMAAVERESA